MSPKKTTESVVRNLPVDRAEEINRHVRMILNFGAAPRFLHFSSAAYTEKKLLRLAFDVQRPDDFQFPDLRTESDPYGLRFFLHWLARFEDKSEVLITSHRLRPATLDLLSLNGVDFLKSERLRWLHTEQGLGQGSPAEDAPLVFLQDFERYQKGFRVVDISGRAANAASVTVVEDYLAPSISLLRKLQETVPKPYAVQFPQRLRRSFVSGSLALLSCLVASFIVALTVNQPSGWITLPLIGMIGALFLLHRVGRQASVFLGISDGSWLESRLSAFRYGGRDR